MTNTKYLSGLCRNHTHAGCPRSRLCLDGFGSWAIHHRLMRTGVRRRQKLMPKTSQKAVLGWDGDVILPADEARRLPLRLIIQIGGQNYSGRA
jgi:hypothetical protein